jgi:hypothetical protein
MGLLLVHGGLNIIQPLSCLVPGCGCLLLPLV